MIFACLLISVSALAEETAAARMLAPDDANRPPTLAPSPTADAAAAVRSPVVVDAAPPCGARAAAVEQELAKHRHHLPGRQARRTARALCHEAERGQLDPLLLLAVIGVESSFNPRAVSPVGAEGLMQLMPHTARYLAARVNLAWSQRVAFDPAINIRIGARYLVTLRDAFHGRLDWALTAYNRGPTATHHLLRAHHGLPHAVHAAYSMRVLRAYSSLQRQYAGGARATAQ